MKASLFRELVLYRYRYVVGYGLFAILLVALLLIDFANIPYGISGSEMKSAVASNSLNPTNPQLGDIINLPYHLLQKLSIGLFGLSAFSVTLPSTLLALASGILMALMLHTWFRRNVAVVTLLVCVVSVPFIAMGRTGTPTILFMFLLLTILYSAIRLTTQATRTFGWKLVVAIASMLLLYVPFGIYTLLALSVAAVFHPHIRYQLRRTRVWQAIIIVCVSLLLLAPHIIAIFSAGGVPVLRHLLGLATIKASFAPDHLKDSAISLIKMLFFFNKPNVSETITPFLNITFMLLVAFGLAKTVINHSMARSYLILIWLVFCIPMLLIDNSQLPLLFVPCILLVAIGIETLMNEWYRLFPLNPYARIAAMVPLGLIVFGLLAIAITRYFYAYTYTDTRNIFHPELTAITTLLDNKPTQLIVPTDHIAFYDILRSKHRQLIVSGPETTPNNTMRQIILASAVPAATKVPSKIVTTYFQHDGVMLRIYEPSH